MQGHRATRDGVTRADNSFFFFFFLASLRSIRWRSDLYLARELKLLWTPKVARRSRIRQVLVDLEVTKEPP